MNTDNILRVGLVQRPCLDNIDANRASIAAHVRGLAADGARLVVLSELHDGPYFCQTENVDNFERAVRLPSSGADFYAALAADTATVIVSSHFERRAPGLYHNTALVHDVDGSLAGIYRKMHIPDDPAYYEKFYFTPGDIGFRPIQTSLGRLGVLVCWDQWYPEAARVMALRGADILIYPTAIGTESTDTPDEQRRQLDAWITVQRGHAVANGLPVVTVNRCGHESDPSGATGGITFWGNSFVAGPQGELLHRSGAAESVPIVDIDMGRCERVRRWWPFLRDRRIDAYKPLLKRYDD